MLLPPRKIGLDSLFKEVRVFKEGARVPISVLGRGVWGRVQVGGGVWFSCEE